MLRFARGRKPRTAAQPRAEYRIAESDGSDQMNQRFGVGPLGHHAGRCGRNTAGVQAVGDLAHDCRGARLLPARIDRGKPGQALRQPVAKRVEHLVELLFERIFRRAHRRDQLVAQLGDGLLGQGTHQPFAAAEMVQDQRVRDAGRGGDLLQPQSLRSGAGDQLLRGFQDQPPRFLGCAARPLYRGAHPAL